VHIRKKMSGPAVVQVSRGALMAMSAGAGSLYMYTNGLVPAGLSAKDLGAFAMQMGGRGSQNKPDDLSLIMSPLAMQLTELNAEVARLRSQSQYAFMHGGSPGMFSWTTIVTVGGVGVLFMYWRGYSFKDVMYVTQTALGVAVETLEFGIENLGVALETAKRELTYKLGLVEDKLDETKVSLENKIEVEVGQVRMDIKGVSNDIQGLSYSHDRVHTMVNNIETQMTCMEGRIDEQLATANKGIYLLCNVVADNLSTGNKGTPSQRPTGTSLYDELISYTRSAVSSFSGKGGIDEPLTHDAALLAGQNPGEAIRSVSERLLRN